MTDEIERRLRREPGERERGYLSPGLPASLPASRGRARTTRSWNRAWAVGAVVATVALAVVAVTFVGDALHGLGGQGDGGIGAGGSPSASPTVVSQPSPTPAPSQGLAACDASDFAVTTAGWDAAMGSRGTTVILRLVDSAAPCTVAGSPAAGIDDGDGGSLVRADARAGQELTLRAGDMVSVAVSWANWCAAAPAQPLGAWLVLPGGDAASAGDRIPIVAASGQQIPVPPCNGPAQPASLNVTDFAPYTGPAPQG
jgi:hypothetical protein